MTRRIVSTPGLMGGYPCFEGTRIPWDTPLRIVDFRTVFPADVPTYYPSLDVDSFDVAMEYSGYGDD